MPDTLYHYTTVESLALILKNKNIKFNSLIKMDDAQEQLSSDYQDLGKICFVSCWTDQHTEKIPMWKMYCPQECGVRISLPTNPFELYYDYEYALSHGIPNLKLKEGGRPYTIIPFKKMIDDGFSLADVHGDYLVTQIEYNNSRNKLCPDIIFENENLMSANIKEFGKYKNEYWKFQSEWRYRLFPLPVPLGKITNPSEFTRIIYSKIKMNQLDLPFDSLFLSIKDECFKKMEILMSPNISPGYQIIIENLIKEYNPCASLIESDLKNLIR